MFVQRREIQGEGSIPHVARVCTVTPYIHAGWREVHVPGHVANRAGLILAQPWLAGASNLFHKSTETGFGLVTQVMSHPAKAVEFADVDRARRSRRATPLTGFARFQVMASNGRRASARMGS